MQFLVAELIGGLAFAMGSLVGRVLLALGIGFITFAGVNTLLANIKNSIFGALNGLPGELVGLIGYMWIDKGITAIMSAWAAAMFLKLAGSDTVTAMITKKP